MNDALIRFQRGFTLIELLVVISIIGLLSSVVLASVSASRASARDAERIANLKQIQNAIELYANDHNGSYPGYLSIGSVGGETPYSRTPALDSEVSSDGCGYGASGTAGAGSPNYAPGVWCRLETALAPYIKKLPRAPKYGGAFYQYTYKVPGLSTTWNPNGIKIYGLGVKLERPSAAAQNDGGYSSTVFELGPLPAFCVAHPSSVGRDWDSWSEVPCSCSDASDYLGSSPGPSCGL